MSKVRYAEGDGCWHVPNFRQFSAEGLGANPRPLIFRPIRVHIGRLDLNDRVQCLNR